MKKVLKILSCIFAILLINGFEIYANESEGTKETLKPSVYYETHVQDIGWQEQVKDGKMAGTESQSKRLEAIKINIQNMENVKIKYQTHIQDIGWQNWKYDGELSGTSGQSKRLEAIRIELEETEEYSIMYRVHVQDIGWQEWKYDGEIAGTSGQSKRLEAIEIKLIEKKAKALIHLEEGTDGTQYYKNDEINISGWKMADVSNTNIEVYLDGKKVSAEQITYEERPDVIKGVIGYGNEKQNSTPGFNIKIDKSELLDGKHSVEINVTDSNGKIIESKTTYFTYYSKFSVTYSVHVQDIGWQEWKKEDNTAGTEGQDKRLEAIQIGFANSLQDAKLKYRVHIQDIGWQEWKDEGQTAGTSGKSKRLEAIEIKIENAEEYSIQYRVHIQDIGWQEWVNDGEMAGTEGQSKRLEAIQIRIVPKIKNNKIEMYIDNPKSIAGAEETTIKGWVMSNYDNTNINFWVNDKIIEDEITRTERYDVIEAVKGYGGIERNPLPGFELKVDLSEYEGQQVKIKVQVVNDENQVLKEKEINVTINHKIEYQSGTYGETGLKISGNNGSDLQYLKYGNGENVFFATFAIHGYEDKWDKDGYELVEIANNFYNKLIEEKDYELANKWTIYIFPGVNQDGLTKGNTNNGPGRTTLYSQAPQNKGIDLNRCWQVGDTYEKFTSNRNYNGETGFQAYEAQALRDFMLANKSKNGQTILVDLHGWTQQLIGDENICSYYEKQFPENNKKSVGRYGSGYMINWGRTYLGSQGKAAKTALIELPKEGVNNHQSVIEKNFCDRYITATIEMLEKII